ncbi:hypothetical protein TNCV_2285731 [Trichonephila clavipes]|nr:hypothetical protein TNCV_2285731 [Trichonephila clavipes]
MFTHLSLETFFASQSGVTTDNPFTHAISGANYPKWDRVIRVTTDDVISRVFNNSSALEQVVAVNSGKAAEWSALVSNQAKSVEVYSPKVFSDSFANEGNRLGFLQVSRDWAHSGQSFPWLSKTLCFLGHYSIFVNVRGDDALLRVKGTSG